MKSAFLFTAYGLRTWSGGDIHLEIAAHEELAPHVCDCEVCELGSVLVMAVRIIGRCCRWKGRVRCLLVSWWGFREVLAGLRLGRSEGLTLRKTSASRYLHVR